MRELHWDGSTLRIRVFGAFTKRSLVDAVSALTADTRYDALQFVVADFLEAEAHEFDLVSVMEDLLAVLLGASVTNPNIRIAVIASEQAVIEVTEALARFQSPLMPEIRAFRDRISAARWVSEQPRLSRPPMRFRP